MRALYMLFFFSAAVVGFIIWSQYGNPVPPDALDLPADAEGEIELKGRPFLIRNHPGKKPDMLSTEQVEIPDEVKVVGVSVGIEHRAYLLDALTEYDAHLVNDMVGEMPISVSYCDLSDCVRVLTAEQESALELAVGGVRQGSNPEMYLMFDGLRYPQKSDNLPFDDHAHERTTWGRWKEKHPDTLVYTGLLYQYRKVPDQQKSTDSDSSAKK